MKRNAETASGITVCCMRNTVHVRLMKNGRMPRRHTAGAAGFDLAAAEGRVIPSHGFALVSTGLALELPPGVEAQVRPRSGLAAKHGIGILNSPGTIDSDYRGEVKVILFNCSEKDYRVRVGERVGQLVFSRVTAVELRRTNRLSGTKRGDGGFGSTG